MMIANKIIVSLPVANLFTLLAHQSIEISTIQANISLSSSHLPSWNFRHCLSNGHNSFAPNKHIRRPRSAGSHGDGTRFPGIPWFITTFPSLVCSLVGRTNLFSTSCYHIARAECCNFSFPSPFRRRGRRESSPFRQPQTATATEPKRPSSLGTILHLSKRNNNNNNRRKSKKIQSLASLLSLEMDLHSRNYAYVIGSDDSGGAGCIAGPVVVASCCVLHPVPLFRAILSESLLDDTATLLPQQQQQSLSLSTEEIQILKQTNDSKLLTPLQRREIYNVLMNHPELFAITTSRRSPQQIDEMDVLTATKEAFAESIEELVLRWDLPRGEVYGVVDGRVAPKVFAYSSKEKNVNVEGECGTDDSVDATKINDGGDDGNNDRIDWTKRDDNYNDQRFPVRPYINGDANVFAVALSSIIAKVTRDDLMKHEIHVKYPEYGFDVHLGYGTRDHVERVHRLGSVEGVHRMTFKQVKGR